MLYPFIPANSLINGVCVELDLIILGAKDGSAWIVEREGLSWAAKMSNELLDQLHSSKCCSNMLDCTERCIPTPHDIENYLRNHQTETEDEELDNEMLGLIMRMNKAKMDM